MNRYSFTSTAAFFLCMGVFRVAKLLAEREREGESVCVCVRLCVVAFLEAYLVSFYVVSDGIIYN